jgi:polyisoprenoid-binding protein YceI
MMNQRNQVRMRHAIAWRKSREEPKRPIFECGRATATQRFGIRRRIKEVPVFIVSLNLGLLLCQGQQVYHLDPAKSVIQVHVSTAGALGFIGHAHLIETRIQEGKFLVYPGNPGKSTVEVEIEASALQVIDPKASSKDRTEIQATMQSDRVLGVKRYPKIVFKSVKIERVEGERLRITGNLTLRSQTNLVTVEASLEEAGARLRAAGTSQLKQTAFGIRPVSAGLGTVRVQDEVKISFEVYGQAKSDPGS